MKDTRNHHGAVGKQQLPLWFGISGAIHLALVGLTAGRQAGWQADEIQVNFYF